MIGITVLGATGSIGINTLDVVARGHGHYRAVALTANSDVERLAELCRIHRPEYAVMMDDQAAERLKVYLRKTNPDIEVLSGIHGLEKVATLPQVDYIMAAIVGAAGLLPTLAAARAGKRILLANKEALVISGHLFMNEARLNRATILPVDSEHNAIFQCMPQDFGRGLETVGVRKIILTASGGPFRTLPPDQLQDVTPEQACAHPNWVMGRKISVDSATMMNKGLEVIEACWLFNTTPDRIEVVVHPQSVIHSLVEYVDGSVLGQLGSPDMRTPIAHALAWPERMDSGVDRLNLLEVARLDFAPPDFARFPCLRLAYEAMKRGGTATATLNAANEAAVRSFLERQIRFTDIPRVIEHVLSIMPVVEAASLDVVLKADADARVCADERITFLGKQNVK